MKYLIIVLLFSIAASSCQYFETEKVSSEKIYKEEIEAIDWKEVDRYPSFIHCDSIAEKPEQKQCFINTINSRLYQSISDKNIIAVHEVYDTVLVDFAVSNKGNLSILQIEMDSVLKKDFPNLEDLLLKTIDSLQPIAPAYKRGIPVKTQFTLPVIIQTN
ncbi:hypothetical protein [Aequorivita echinoideorum]|uniref:TonB protein C-terminal n=1 Tax=Aequorivita echinoideorum TaxID=1549647 RepID=A0ABS5S0T2_9FLAO|nr:hypothetical protein [Aequorivita echinoideorum]MBT0606811.1 hypothetical protein [Aequorivita echinoideorum]